MAKLDERGSKLQHLIYNLAVSAYHPYEVVYEYPIGDLHQRIDIFIPLLGIALEIDGIQHFEYNKFFFKDENAWNYSVLLNTKKERYLHDKGVKLVRIPYNTHIKTVEQLKEAIESVPFPENEYDLIDTKSQFQRLKQQELKEKNTDYKAKQKERNKALYEKRKAEDALRRKREKAKKD